MKSDSDLSTQVLPGLEVTLDNHRDKGTSIVHAEDPSVTTTIYSKNRNMQSGSQQSVSQRIVSHFLPSLLESFLFL